MHNTKDSFLFTQKKQGNAINFKHFPVRVIKLQIDEHSHCNAELTKQVF